MEKLNISVSNITKRNVVDLHIAINKLALKIAKDERGKKQIGKTTVKAIKDIQKRNKLATTGKLNAKTLNALNAELFDVHHTQSKTRTEKPGRVHSMHQITLNEAINMNNEMIFSLTHAGKWCVKRTLQLHVPEERLVL